ncbi:MAG: AAA family ATPase [Acidobacteria bacterium]|nr:AAA family ATPase [Acidobacteriota bacterium]
MYESFFGLYERPFDLTPNPRYLVLTDAHREALSNLEYAITSRKGVTLLLGEAGTGKTTIIRTAIERQPERVHCVHLQNPTLERSEFVEMLARLFGLSERASESKTACLIELEKLLVSRSQNGESTVLVVDEAQSLPLELLEEIRLLANIETNSEKLLSVILAGQPELAERLNERSLRQLKQRVALRCQLKSLGLQETCAYVAGRIRAAGGVGSQAFTREAVALMHERSKGIPRTLNVIADNAMLTAFATGRRPVNTKVVLEVCVDLDLGRGTVAPPLPMMESPQEAPPSPSRPVRLITIDSEAAPAEAAPASPEPVAETPADTPADATADPQSRKFSLFRAPWIRGTNESS